MVLPPVAAGPAAKFTGGALLRRRRWEGVGVRFVVLSSCVQMWENGMFGSGIGDSITAAVFLGASATIPLFLSATIPLLASTTIPLLTVPLQPPAAVGAVSGASWGCAAV